MVSARVIWTLSGVLATLPCTSVAQKSDDARYACLSLAEQSAFEVEPANPNNELPALKAEVEAYLDSARARNEELRDRLEQASASASETAMGFVGTSSSMALSYPERIPPEPPPQEVTFDESQLIQEVVKWMEERAAAEVALWFMQVLSERICARDERTRNFFPNSCRYMDGSSIKYSGSISSRALVRALRSDLQDVPSCAIYRKTGNAIGYRLASIYRQYRDGENIEKLLYGLVQSGGLAQPGPGCEDEGCEYALPFIAYAAALEAIQLYDPADMENSFAAYVAFQLAFERHLVRNRLYNISDGESPLFLPASLPDHETGSIDQFENGLRAFLRVRQELKRKLEFLSKEKSEAELAANQRDYLNALFDIGELTIDMLGAATHMRASISEDPGSLELEKFARQIHDMEKFTGAMLAANNSLAIGAYSEAVIVMEPVAKCLGGEANASSCPTWLAHSEEGGGWDLDWLTRSAHTAAALADARDSESFAAALDAAASPIGAYRRRFDDSMWSLNGYFGIDLSESTVSIPEAGPGGATLNNTYGAMEVFAPLGITYSRPCGNFACGLHLQLVNLGVLAGDYQGQIVDENMRYTIQSETTAEFGSIVSPGLFFVFSPRDDMPFVVGAGASIGPTNYKQANLPDGRTVPVEREHAWTVFVAIDLALFSF